MPGTAGGRGRACASPFLTQIDRRSTLRRPYKFPGCEFDLSTLSAYYLVAETNSYLAETQEVLPSASGWQLSPSGPRAAFKVRVVGNYPYITCMTEGLVVNSRRPGSFRLPAEGVISYLIRLRLYLKQSRPNDLNKRNLTSVQSWLLIGR